MFFGNPCGTVRAAGIFHFDLEDDVNLQIVRS